MHILSYDKTKINLIEPTLYNFKKRLNFKAFKALKFLKNSIIKQLFN